MAKYLSLKPRKGGQYQTFTLTIYHIKASSILKLKHGKNTLLLLPLWAFGAFIIGWLGQMVNIFVVSIAASVVVGFSWPVLFTKMLELRALEEANNEPEQQMYAEL